MNVDTIDHLIHESKLLASYRLQKQSWENINWKLCKYFGKEIIVNHLDPNIVEKNIVNHHEFATEIGNVVLWDIADDIIKSIKANWPDAIINIKTIKSAW